MMAVIPMVVVGISPVALPVRKLTISAWVIWPPSWRVSRRSIRVSFPRLALATSRLRSTIARK